jgi:hypothetical protein
MYASRKNKYSQGLQSNEQGKNALDRPPDRPNLTSLEKSRDEIHGGIRTLQSSCSQHVVDALDHVDLLQVPRLGAFFIIDPRTGGNISEILGSCSSHKLKGHGATSTGKTNGNNKLGFGENLVS